MEILLNSKNEIINYAIVGHVDGFTEFSGEIPEDFIDRFEPSIFLIKENTIVENPDYVAPEPPVIGPSNLEKQVAMIGYQQMQDNQDKQTLVKQNAQMAYQIMQIQQQLGGQKA